MNATQLKPAPTGVPTKVSADQVREVTNSILRGGNATKIALLVDQAKNDIEFEKVVAGILFDAVRIDKKLAMLVINNHDFASIRGYSENDSGISLGYRAVEIHGQEVAQEAMARGDPTILSLMNLSEGHDTIQDLIHRHYYVRVEPIPVAESNAGKK